MKTCYTCGIEKDYSFFNKKSRSTDGYATRCKACKKIWEDSYYERIGRKLKKVYRINNLASEKARQRIWQKKNQHVKNFYTAKYRALKKNATPSWLTAEQLKEIKLLYKKARSLTKSTGIPYQVDHIIPIRGKEVTGLHVPWNLQILTAQENQSKNNTLFY